MGEARRIDGAIPARKQAGPDCERRVEQALAALAARRQPITLQAVLQQAGVSRSFIYSRPQLRAKIPAGGPRRATAREAARDYDLPRVASLQARLQQTNAELLAVRKQLRATERALASAGGTDTRLANDSELEECKGGGRPLERGANRRPRPRRTR